MQGGAGRTVGFWWCLQAKAISFDKSPQMSNLVFEKSGVVLNVTPTIEKYNSINLRLNPKVTEFDGFIEYGGQHCVIGWWRRGLLH